MTVCIYAIWFPEANDNSVYVGQSRVFEKRCKEHLLNAKKVDWGSKKLYNWIRARQCDGFDIRFDILQECSPDELNRQEDVWQAFFKEFGWESKHLKGGENQTGYVPTEEHKAKLSAAKLGKKRGPMSEETKRKIGAANSGLVRSPEVVENNRQKRLGHKQTPEQIAKRVASIAAKPEDEKMEMIRKRVEKVTGQKRSPETRERMRFAQLGKTASPETKQKLSALRRGVKRGPYKKATNERT